MGQTIHRPDYDFPSTQLEIKWDANSKAFRATLNEDIKS